MMPRQAYNRGRVALGRALRLDPRHGRALTLQAIAHYAYEWDFDSAETTFRRAIESDPRDPMAREWYARYLAVVGRFDEAITQVARLRELDPLAYARPMAASDT